MTHFVNHTTTKSKSKYSILNIGSVHVPTYFKRSPVNEDIADAAKSVGLAARSISIYMSLNILGR